MRWPEMAFHYIQLHEVALGMLKTANRKRNTDKKRIDELKEELDYYQEGVMAVGDERDRLKVDLERTKRNSSSSNRSDAGARTANHKAHGITKEGT